MCVLRWCRPCRAEWGIFWVNNDDDQHELYVDDDPTKDVQELVESDDAADNSHEDYIDDDMMSVTDLDDNDDMSNPYNVDSVSNDTDDEMDEEDDDVDEEDNEIYWKVNI